MKPFKYPFHLILECLMFFKRIGTLNFLSFLLISMLTLAGCATLDKNECLNADWQTIGFEDGAKGYAATRIRSHRKACAKHGVAPDFETYEAGRLKGLEQWCKPRNGYYLGVRGERYNGVCPDYLVPAFVEALNLGRALYEYEKQVKKHESELRKMNAALETMDEDILALEDEMVSDGVSPRRRLKLLDEIRMLEDDRSLQVNDIAEMEHALNDMRTNLELMRTDHPYQ
jgi:hypothetical protein